MNRLTRDNYESDDGGRSSPIKLTLPMGSNDGVSEESGNYDNNQMEC